MAPRIRKYSSNWCAQGGCLCINAHFSRILAMDKTACGQYFNSNLYDNLDIYVLDIMHIIKFKVETRQSWLDIAPNKMLKHWRMGWNIDKKNGILGIQHSQTGWLTPRTARALQCNIPALKELIPILRSWWCHQRPGKLTTARSRSPRAVVSFPGRWWHINSPSGCGELPRSLVTPQWPKSRYQFLFYHDAS